MVPFAAGLIINDEIVFHGSVGFVDAHGQRQGDCRGGHPHHDCGQDKHVRQRVGVDGNALFENGRGPANDLARGYEQDENGGLEQVESHDFFHHVAARNHGIKADHHDGNDNPVVASPPGGHPPSPETPSSSWRRWANSENSTIMTVATVRPTPSSTEMMPNCSAAWGLLKKGSKERK